MKLVYGTIAWLLGIWLAQALGGGHPISCHRYAPAAWFALAAGAALAAWQLRRSPLARAMGLIACLLLGFSRYQARPLFPCTVESHVLRVAQQSPDGVRGTVTGLIIGDVDVRDQGLRFVVEASSISIDGQQRELQGKVLIRAPRFVDARYGDRVRLAGTLSEPPIFEDFDYRAYLARQGIYGVMKASRVDVLSRGHGSAIRRWLLSLRHDAASAIARMLPEPSAALLQGILLGIESGIPPALYDAFNATATSHIIVISGFNITIVAGLLAAALRRLPWRGLSTLGILAGIGLYVMLVGADAAVVRAGIMGGLGVIAIHYGRRSVALVSLAASAWLMTALNPLTLWDIGFQLSAMATLGLILISPGLQAWGDALLQRLFPASWARSLGGFLNEGLWVTLAAQATTTPLVVYYFGRLSIVSLLTNLLILPAQPFIMTWGGAATLVALAPTQAAHIIAQWIAWVPWLCLTYTVWAVELTARLPGASVEVPRMSALWPTAYYVGLAAWLWRERIVLWRHRLGALLGTRPQIRALALLGGAACALIWLAAAQAPDGLLHVSFLDVGQGDAILIQTPRGHQILIDGGPSPTLLAWQLGRQMPFWDREIDLVVLTHPDGDHMTGLIPLLDRYRVEQVLDSPLTESAREAKPWLAAQQRVRVERLVAQRGQRIDTGDGVSIEVLHPPPEDARGHSGDNDSSTVLRLRYGEVCFLFTGDLETPGEEALLASGAPLTCTVLKVAHHGSATGTSQRFLDAVRPRIAVIQVGADNRFGHPSEAVLQRLSGIRIYRTDRDGTITLTTDGHRLWASTSPPARAAMGMR